MIPHHIPLLIGTLLAGLLMAGCSYLNPALEPQQQALNMQRQALRETRLINRMQEPVQNPEKSAAERAERIAYLTAITPEHYRPNCNMEALAQIQPPMNPSDAEADRYIMDILAASALQEDCHHKDPQVFMLAELGEERVPELLDYLRMHPRGGQHKHLFWALQHLATETTKATILADFSTWPHQRDDWVSFIQWKHWEQDTKELLIKFLHDRLDDPTVRFPGGSAINVLASFQDPATYPLLIRCLVEKQSRDYTYKVITALPGIERQLNEVIPEVWERAQSSNYPADVVAMAQAAIALGDPKALDVLMKHLEPGQVFYSDALLRTVQKHIAFSGSSEEIRRWYYGNHERIQFNPEKVIFYVEEPIEADGTFFSD